MRKVVTTIFKDPRAAFLFLAGAVMFEIGIFEDSKLPKDLGMVDAIGFTAGGAAMMIAPFIRYYCRENIARDDTFRTKVRAVGGGVFAFMGVFLFLCSLDRMQRDQDWAAQQNKTYHINYNVTASMITSLILALSSLILFLGAAKELCRPRTTERMRAGSLNGDGAATYTAMQDDDPEAVDGRRLSDASQGTFDSGASAATSAGSADGLVARSYVAAGTPPHANGVDLFGSHNTTEAEERLVVVGGTPPARRLSSEYSAYVATVLSS